MKTKLFITIAILLLGLSLYIVHSPENAQNDVTSSDSESNYGKAPDFTLVDLNGKEVSLSDFKGKKVFLNFWVTWCPPCKAEMPEIEKVYQETKDSDLVILAVEIGESKNTVSTFISDNDYNFKVLLDQDETAAASYGFSAIPTSYFIDEKGNIVDKRTGGMSYDEMKEYIEKLK